MIAGWHATAGIIIAVTSPFLGAASDRMGRRKPLLAVCIAALALCVAAMWWALPNERWPADLAARVVDDTASGVAFVYTEVLHNSMLTRAAPPGIFRGFRAWAWRSAMPPPCCFLFVLVTMALPGQVALPFLPDAPCSASTAPRMSQTAP
jgi:UMF1 family MFS transporter